MKDLITIDGNKVIPSPYALTIKEFKALKIEELSAVYFFADHRSPFVVYPELERWEKINETIKAALSPKTKAAIDKYRELSETSAVKLLNAARESVSKLEKYFKDIDLTLTDDNGRPIYHAKDLIANLANMGKVVSGLDELEELVKKQQQKDNPNRGGVVVNKYSQ
jgi:hypothetical protein